MPRLLQTLDRRFETSGFRADPFPGLFDDPLFQAKPSRDGKRVGFTGNPNQQAIGRPQRLDIKLTGCVLNPCFVGRIDLEFGIVGGCRNDGAAAPGVLDDGNRQCRAFCGVRACSELIKQYQ